MKSNTSAIQDSCLNLFTNYEQKKYNYQKFVIISAARSGSWYLSSLLASHTNIICFGELFHRYRIFFSYPGYKQFTNLKRLRKKDPVKFLERIIFKKYPKNIHAVGFKYLYYQMNIGGFRPINLYLKNLPNLKIIHLKRTNLLKRYVSYMIAYQIDRWRCRTERDLEKSRRVVINIDYEGCKEFFKESIRREKKSENYFKNVPMIEVIYENIVKDFNKETNLIQKFIGVNIESLTSPYKKQNRRPLSEVISNYWELKEKFKNSKWIRFFEDSIK